MITGERPLDATKPRHKLQRGFTLGVEQERQVEEMNARTRAIMARTA
jgi:hypothetical protein